MSRGTSRRTFCHAAATAAACTLVRAQAPSPAHRNVTELDRDTILRQAQAARAVSVQAPPQQHFHSEIEPNLSTAGQTSSPRLLRADALALQAWSQIVAALTAGYLVSREEAYAKAAIAHLHPWLIASDTRLEPAFDQAGCSSGTSTGTPAGVVDLTPLAEVARALSFLTDSLRPEDLATIQAWLTDAGQWLDNNKQAFIAREAKDHRASAWLFLRVAVARFLRDEKTLEDSRKRFRAHTLRNQVASTGVFPQEVATPNPYRNTLFNFDLLAGACQLLSSPFDPLWTYELNDGVGLRVVSAYLYPVIAHPERWGYPADAQHFRDLPGRRPALLFAGRAFDRPEYVELWQSLPSTVPEALGETFPIRQPSLWTARAPHGL